MSVQAPALPETSATGRLAPSKYRFFPGWTMLGIAAVAQFMSAPGQSYSVAALKGPMRESLGTSETSFSLAYTVATVVSALLVPVCGRLLDRHGARIMLPAIAAGLGLACFQMSRTQTLPELYFAFCFVRTLGQGALFLASIWLVGEWFEHKRGIATAIAGLGGGLSVMTVPILNNAINDAWGWPTTWTFWAVAVSAALVVPGILFIRSRPEELGLHPDGIDPESIDANASAQSSDSASRGPTITALEDSWTVREAMRDPTFWKLLSVPMTSGLVGTGLVFYQVDVFGRHGLTSQTALALMSIQALVAMTMSFPAGYLTDRLPSRYLLFAAMVMLASATLLAIILPFTWMALLYAVLLGLHGSILRSTATVVWINYYGRAHQGEVRGLAWSFMIYGAAVGPLPLALSIDHLGSPAPALCAFLVLPILAGIAVSTATPPERPAAA